MNAVTRLLLSLIFCCFAGSLAAATTTLSFWNNQQASGPAKAIAEDFFKHSGIKVETTWIIQADYRTQLLRHMADGTPPDVALVAADFLAMDKELRLSTLPSGAASRDVVENALPGGVYEGRQLGAPIVWGNQLMLYYNRSFVTQPATNFAEMLQQAPALKARGVKPLGMNFGEMYWMVPFLGAYGGWPLNAKGAITLDSPAMAQTLDTYFGLVKQGLTLKECRIDCALDRFMDGEFAYSINGDWAYLALLDALGDKLGVTTLPAIDTKHPLVPMFSAYVLIFPNHSLEGPKRAALLKFLHYMQSAEVQRRWFQEAKLLPVNKQIYREIATHDSPYLKTALAQLRQARAMPNDRGMAFAWDGMAKGYSAYYNDLANARQAATLMQQHAEKAAHRSDD